MWLGTVEATAQERHSSGEHCVPNLWSGCSGHSAADRERIVLYELLASEPVTDGFTMRRILALEICGAKHCKGGVELVQVSKRWSWPEEVGLDEAIGALDSTFLISLGLRRKFYVQG